MVTSVKIGYTEQSKAVTASVSIESDEISADEIRKEAERLYNDASKFSALKTMHKVRRR